MSLATVITTIIFLAIAIYCSVEIYDFIQVRRGIFPRKSETTLDDIRRLRDEGYRNIAVRRFMRMRENRHKYTDVGAKQKVDEL